MWCSDKSHGKPHKKSSRESDSKKKTYRMSCTSSTVPRSYAIRWRGPNGSSEPPRDNLLDPLESPIADTDWRETPKKSPPATVRLFRSIDPSPWMQKLEGDRTSMPLANSTAYKMSSKTTGRSIADKSRQPSLDVLMRARDQRWNYLGHILRMEEHRVTRKVLLQCVKPIPESLFGDVPDLDIYTAINLAINRVEWKESRQSRRC